jgi:Fe(3+) dicitrate transport protein
MKTSLLPTLLLCSVSLSALATTPQTKGIDAQQRLLPPSITITKGSVYGGEQQANLPGSSAALSAKTLQKAGGSVNPTTVVRQLPGVNVQEEDGFGLRPNIGMRGGRGRS